jgi:type I restriction enzyme R subunit
MTFNETETRVNLINPKLENSGWGMSGSRVRHEFQITRGRIQVGGKRAPNQIADYLLEFRGSKLAVIEAKKESLHFSDGVAQAKEYAQKLNLRFTYSTNGHQIYEMDLHLGQEREIDVFPTPDELWNRTFAGANDWEKSFSNVRFEDKGGLWQPRYYQEVAVERVLESIANDKKRILLTLATGTGKTAIAFQIAWKLFETKWNISGKPTRRPRILFLADRNILANQAYNAFGAFPEDALVRIKPSEISRQGVVPKNGNLFFTIFQTFMSESTGDSNFGQYPPDFFDFVVVDECHRGGANDESNWRKILEHFAPAVQLGLTATPKRKDNVDTYAYFGEPVFTYSLKDGINDGFLTPFRVRKFTTSLDSYQYTPEDDIVEGEVEGGRVYEESDFNKNIEILERERKRVELFMAEIDQNQKTLVFCASQRHAGIIAALINQVSTSTNPDYCHRVTADDGERGEAQLRAFQDNDKTIPTVLTTSQKLSTGVDALNVRNIVLLRPVNSMIEFKQIIGRGTRLFEGKDYFTVYDFVKAHEHFADPEWDGEPENPEPKTDPVPRPPKPDVDPNPSQKQRIVIKLRDGKERAIKHFAETSFIGPDGLPMTSQEFIAALFETLTLPEFFSSEAQLREIWSSPETRLSLLQRLSEAGFGQDGLMIIQQLIEAEDSDLFDVLEYIAFAKQPISRLERAMKSRPELDAALTAEQMEFVDFVLLRYVETGVEELFEEKLPALLKLKYQALRDGINALGGQKEARMTFFTFQKYLYQSA